MAVQAKTQRNGIETFRGGEDPKYWTNKVRLGAIYGNAGENKNFANATPNDEYWMQISASCPALEFFKPGKRYYVTFTEAPD